MAQTDTLNTVTGMHGLLPLALSLGLHAAAAADVDDGEEEEPTPWAGSSVSVGTALLAGNSRSFILTGDLLAQYQGEAWEFLGELSTVYGWSAEAGAEDDEPTSEWLHLSARGEHIVGEWLTAFGMFGGVINHPASLEGRIEGEVGAGFRLLEVEEDDAQVALIRLYLGFHVSNDYRFQFFPVPRDLPDLFNAGPGAGARLKWVIHQRLSLSQTAAFYPNVIGDFRVIAYSDTELSSFFDDHLALSLHLLIEHDSRAAAEKVPTDAALTVGLELLL